MASGTAVESLFGLALEKPIAVYGLGAGGRAAALRLAEAGHAVWALDDSLTTLPPELTVSPHIVLKAAPEVAWGKVQYLIKAPGIGMDAAPVVAAIKKGVPVWGETELLWRREQNSGAIWLGITGTNGKSTTTALVGHLLRAAGKSVAVGGNIGVPALELPSIEKGGFYVLELSSYQLEMQHEVAVDGAIFLNLTPDHLERHGTMEGYLAAKLKLFETAQAHATKVLGIDQDILANVAAQGGVVSIAATEPMAAQADYAVREGAIWQGSEKCLELADYPHLPGPHNGQNLMAALALLVPRWLTLEQFKAGAASFKGLPHRLEKVATLHGIPFINDSKATNGDSAVYALQSYPAIYWICGGKPKTDGLGACLDHLGAVRAAFTIGQAGADFAAAIKAKGTAAFEAFTLERAVAEAYAAARTERLAGAVVLLSPAAASFDQFKNFEHRGDTFANCVRQLAEQESRKL